MNKNKLVWVIAILIFLILAFNIYLYTQLKRTKSISTPVLHATPALTPGYQKISGEGNSIIYNSSIRLTFSGSGYVRTTGKDSNTPVEYIVGRFIDWQKIPDSHDKYIVVKEYNNEKVYKARTMWTSDLSSSTLLVKEDVSKIGINGLENGYLLRLGTIDNQKELYKNRIISVLLKIDKTKRTALADENNIPIVDAIIVR